MEVRGTPAEAEAHARLDEVDGVVTVTFTRDDKLNAVDQEMLDTLARGIELLADDDGVRVLVITGQGRYFTSGVDISVMQGTLGEGTDGVVRGSNIRRQYRRQACHDLYDMLETIEKPVIIAAQGPCYGLGIELAGSCDFRLASDTATFRLPEIANLAVLPGSGGISRLTRLIGPHWTKWLAMAGESMDAAQALQIGLVHAVYPSAEFPERVSAFARKLAALPREAMGLAKLAIDTAASVDRRTARDVDRLAQSLLFTSAEHREKVEAFMARSKPAST